MRTVSIFRNNKNQAVRIPRDLEFQGVSKVEIIPQGNALLLRPCRPSWSSLGDTSAAGGGFLANRPDTIEEGGRLRAAARRHPALGRRSSR